MTNPVTIPCGHSYCMSCIKDYWDQDQFRTARCPQCRHEFSTRPTLNKNTMLAEILEKLRTTSVQDSPPAPTQPKEVECDFCTDIKVKAVRSCLECRASYCEEHVQDHYNFPALKKHTLVVATDIPMCPRHDRLLEAFCRTDNTCICMSCVMDEHKSHDTVSSKVERDEKQVTLQASKRKFMEEREKKEKELDELRRATEAHTQATQQSVEATELAFSSLISTLEKSCSEVKEKIRAQEKTYQDQSAYLQEQLELHIAMLTGQEDIMDKLLQTEDNVSFLQNFDSMPSPSGAEESPSHTLEPLVSFSDVSNIVSVFKAKLESFGKQELDNMFAKFDIKVGDRVRVKSSVSTPTHTWGHSVTHKSVGVVKSVNDETVIIDFPGYKNWKGVLTEMECVPAAAELVDIKVGDRVRVKSSVSKPTHNWGHSVTHKSVGVVKSVNNETVIIDFPGHKNWKGVLTEMKCLPAAAELGISYQQRRIKVGDRVQVKRSVTNPKEGWGRFGVSHQSVGVVKSLAGEKIIVDFPEYSGWKGVISEMEIVS